MNFKRHMNWFAGLQYWFLFIFPILILETIIIKLKRRKKNPKSKMENKFIKLNPSVDWSEYTLIISCVSVGNIGQLAADLLISTLPQTQKAGYLISTLVQPIVGHDAFVHNSPELSLSCERNKYLEF